MLLTAAHKDNATAMEYYMKRIAALKNLLPEQYPFLFTVETELVGEGLPVTYITMSKFRHKIKTWVLIITDEHEDDQTENREFISLKRYTNWSKVKRHIVLEIRQMLDQIEK
ncbi:hypothetical protein [Enterococcus timonensis]|uniref:hypothetical protein n=1 Tax=Enterococcus timonensis TaxID=1852364 RepID=UPI0008D95674|nr:hypothetical protein [Enterococcus timonensis]